MIPSYTEWLKNARRTFLLEVLREAKGNQCVAAEALGIHRNTLSRMMQADGIPAPAILEIRKAQPIIAVPGHSNHSTQRIYQTKAREDNGTYPAT